MTRTLTVILDWNQPAQTCEAAVAALAQVEPGCHDVLVIDNGSTAANHALLRAGLPAGCELLRNRRNLGFAAGMNVGITRALSGSYDYVWLLNNDAIPARDCLKQLIAVANANASLACLTPALTYADGRPQTVGCRLELDPIRQHPFGADATPEPVGRGYWLVGAALFCRVSALARTGGFDDRFFAYWEEVDLQQRLVELGYTVQAVPRAKCVHLVSVSTGGVGSPFTEYMIARNAWLYLRKHVPSRHRRAALLRLFADHLERVGGFLSRGQSAAGRAVFRGSLAGATGRVGPPGSLRTGSVIGQTLLEYPGVALRVLRRVAHWMAPAIGSVP